MIEIILLDIEGTTTPIDFVHNTLFPYAKEGLGDYVASRFDQLGEMIEELRSEHSLDSDYAAAFDPKSPMSVADYLEYLIEIDRKSRPLKAIQGAIWEVGYESGELKSEIFDDVPEAFARWKDAGRTIAIYSSGSVLAQQLLFRYTRSGDLTRYISHYFDTEIGGKKEAGSYLRIADSLAVPPAAIMFVSDVAAELAAARDAGLSPVLSVRPGNKPVENSDEWIVVKSFAELG